MSSQQLDITADDDSNSSSVKGRMNAIHALMTISEPTGFNDNSYRSNGDNIGHGLDGPVSRSRNSDWDNMNPAQQPTSTSILSGVVRGTFEVVDNVGGKQIMCRECPTSTSGFSDPYFLINFAGAKSGAGAGAKERARVRESCRCEGCNEEVLTVSLDDKFHARNNENEEKIYDNSGFCKKHLLGSKKCEFAGCDKCAQGSTKFCIKHGGMY